MRRMSRTARYMMMQNGRNNSEQYRDNRRDNSNRSRETENERGREVRNNYNNYEVDNRYRSNNYEAENRFRDRRGREHYDNGRFAPMRNEYGDGMEMQYRGENSGRTRNEGGGYIANNYDGEYTWPTGNKEEQEKDQDPWQKYDGGRVIGFAAAMNSKGNSASPFNKEMAEEWMANIRNEDGSKGPHWSLEEVKRVMNQKGIECDPVKLWAAVNAEYSDRQAVNKKYGVDKLDFYVDSAIAYWLQDKDAVKDKLSAYYTHVVKH